MARNDRENILNLTLHSIISVTEKVKNKKQTEQINSDMQDHGLYVETKCEAI